jgi:hypothetical protein
LGGPQLADRYIERFSGGFDGIDFSRYSKVRLAWSVTPDGPEPDCRTRRTATQLRNGFRSALLKPLLSRAKRLLDMRSDKCDRSTYLVEICAGTPYYIALYSNYGPWQVTPRCFWPAGCSRGVAAGKHDVDESTKAKNHGRQPKHKIRGGAQRAGEGQKEQDGPKSSQ